MLLLTISLVLIIIAVYAIYRHFKSRSTNTLDARRHNKNVSLLILPLHVFFHSSCLPLSAINAPHPTTVSSLRPRQLLTGSVRSVTIAGCFVEVAHRARHR